MNKIIFFLLLSLPLLCASQDLTDHLLLHYALDGNADDSSGNNYNGAVYGPTPVADRFGNPNSAYHFDGIDDYINFPNLSGLKPQLPVSFAFWVKYESNDYQQQVIFNTSYEENHATSVVFNSGGPLNQYVVNFADGSYFYGSGSRRSYASNRVVDTSVWHFIVAVINSASDMKIYIDCIEAGGTSSGEGGNLQYSLLPGTIGRHDRSLSLPSGYFKGCLDDFRYWDRELTDLEIQALCCTSQTFAITATALCDGQPGQLQVQNDPSVSYQWWESGNPGIILSTSNILSFNPFSNSGSPGTYFVRIYSSSSLPCIDQALSYTVSPSAMPNAGTDASISICQLPASVNLFDILVGSFDAVGIWQQLTPGGTLTGSQWFSGGLPDGSYRFRYVVNDACGNSDYSFVNISVGPPASPSILMATEYCAGSDIAFDVPEVPGAAYNWNGPDNFSSNIRNPVLVSSSTANSGIYTVTEMLNGCQASSEIEITVNSPVNFTIQTVDWTYHENTITIVTEQSDNSSYSYSLDNVHFQTSNVFEGLQPGEYTVYVREGEGCETVQQPIYLLGYPRFFTPNVDGFNERWQIYFCNSEPDLEVRIFDRYGKLLTVFGSDYPGWDGTYNGHNMPSDDYWFVVIRQNGKEYRGHFAIKR